MTKHKTTSLYLHSAATFFLTLRPGFSKLLAVFVETPFLMKVLKGW